MTQQELISAITQTWLSDEPLTAFCQTNYGKSPTIYIGLNVFDPPAQETYPVLVIDGITRKSGIGSNKTVYAVELGAALINESIKRNSDNTTIELEGFTHVKTLIELSENALINARIGKIDWAGESGSVSEHPIHVGFSSITIEVINSRKYK